MIEPKTSDMSMTNPETSMESVCVGRDSGYLSDTRSLHTTWTITLIKDTDVDEDVEDDTGLIMMPASQDMMNRVDESEEPEEDQGKVIKGCIPCC